MVDLKIPESLFIAKNNKKISYSFEINLYFHTPKNLTITLKKLVENFDEINLFQ